MDASAILLSRHMPRRLAAPARPRSFNHAVRAHAKRLALSPDAADLCERLGLPHAASAGPGSLRPQLESDLRCHYGVAPRPPPRLRCRSHNGHARGRGRDAADAAAEGRDLARSEVPLPSDAFRLARRPPLAREDAFRDDSTARGKVRLRRPAPLADDDAQVAELYRMGLLYDDADAADAADALDLNSIRHEQPVYSIRPARPRVRKRSSPGPRRPLHLDLSFSDLGDDTAIAQFLVPPGPLTPDPERAAPRPRSIAAPLRVVYELAGSQPTFDVDTSQPPDLVTDLLSDYDCFSDAELDDVPSQREVHEAGAADAWVVLGDDT